jgi:hypothetical protein
MLLPAEREKEGVEDHGGGDAGGRCRRPLISVSPGIKAGLQMYSCAECRRAFQVGSCAGVLDACVSSALKGARGRANAENVSASASWHVHRLDCRQLRRGTRQITRTADLLRMRRAGAPRHVSYTLPQDIFICRNCGDAHLGALPTPFTSTCHYSHRRGRPGANYRARRKAAAMRGPAGRV